MNPPFDEVVLCVKWRTPSHWDDDHREFMRGNIVGYLAAAMEEYMPDTEIERLS